MQIFREIIFRLETRNKKAFGFSSRYLSFYCLRIYIQLYVLNRCQPRSQGSLLPVPTERERIWELGCVLINMKK